MKNDLTLNLTEKHNIIIFTNNNDKIVDINYCGVRVNPDDFYIDKETIDFLRNNTPFNIPIARENKLNQVSLQNYYNNPSENIDVKNTLNVCGLVSDITLNVTNVLNEHLDVLKETNIISKEETNLDNLLSFNNDLGASIEAIKEFMFNNELYNFSQEHDDVSASLAEAASAIKLQGFNDEKTL